MKTTTLDAPSGVCIGSFVLVCRPSAPLKTENIALIVNATINTDQDPRCVLLGQCPARRSYA